MIKTKSHMASTLWSILFGYLNLEYGMVWISDDIWFLSVSGVFALHCTSFISWFYDLLQSSTIFAVSYDVLSRLQCNSQRALSRRQSPGSSGDEVPKPPKKSKHIEIEKSHRNIDNSIIIQWNHVESRMTLAFIGSSLSQSQSLEQEATTWIAGQINTHSLETQKWCFPKIGLPPNHPKLAQFSIENPWLGVAFI